MWSPADRVEERDRRRTFERSKIPLYGAVLSPPLPGRLGAVLGSPRRPSGYSLVHGGEPDGRSPCVMVTSAVARTAAGGQPVPLGGEVVHTASVELAAQSLSAVPWSNGPLKVDGRTLDGYYREVDLVALEWQFKAFVGKKHMILVHALQVPISGVAIVRLAGLDAYSTW